MIFMNKIILLLLFIFSSCWSKSNETKKQFPEMSEIKQDGVNQDITLDRINGAIGLIITSDNYQFGEVISVYTQEDKLLTEIVRTDENQTIVLKCIAQENQYYKVKLDNEQEGYIPKKSDKIIFQTWEEHILDVFSVDFNIKANPLRSEPIEDSKPLYFDRDEFYHPNQIKGDWLQVKWGSDGNWSYGWVKWKSEGKLLIDLYYLA